MKLRAKRNTGLKLWLQNFEKINELFMQGYSLLDIYEELPTVKEGLSYSQFQRISAAKGYTQTARKTLNQLKIAPVASTPDLPVATEGLPKIDVPHNESSPALKKKTGNDSSIKSFNFDPNPNPDNLI